MSDISITRGAVHELRAKIHFEHKNHEIDTDLAQEIYDMLENLRAAIDAAEADKRQAVLGCAIIADVHADLLCAAIKQAGAHEADVIMALITAEHHARQIAAEIREGVEP